MVINTNLERNAFYFSYGNQYQSINYKIGELETGNQYHSGKYGKLKNGKTWKIPRYGNWKTWRIGKW